MLVDVMKECGTVSPGSANLTLLRGRGGVGGMSRTVRLERAFPSSEEGVGRRGISSSRCLLPRRVEAGWNAMTASGEVVGVVRCYK